VSLQANQFEEQADILTFHVFLLLIVPSPGTRDN
jgi:hypothetical protein